MFQNLTDGRVVKSVQQLSLTANQLKENMNGLQQLEWNAEGETEEMRMEMMQTKKDGMARELQGTQVTISSMQVLTFQINF